VGFQQKSERVTDSEIGSDHRYSNLLFRYHLLPPFFEGTSLMHEVAFAYIRANNKRVLH
jgi:hypothetical protein